MSVEFGHVFSVSGRQLAERTGLSRATCSNILRLLVELGHLERHRTGIDGYSPMYDLILKELQYANLDTHPEREERVSKFAFSDQSEIAFHECFVVSDVSRRLPDSCGVVLSDLVTCGEWRTVKQLAESTGLSIDTVRRAVRRLGEIGAVDVAGGRPLRVMAREDHLEALDRWCEESGAGDRREALRQKHALERKAYEEFLVRRQASQIEQLALLDGSWGPDLFYETVMTIEAGNAANRRLRLAAG